MAGLKLVLITLALLAWLGVVRTPTEEETGFLDRTYKDPEGKEARYVVYVPADYTGKKAYPLILFLHGAGETGTDGRRQLDEGLGQAIKKNDHAFPFITVFPQSQHRTWQADSPDARRALDILAEVRQAYKVDPKRIYLTGLSMGGYGTWSLAARYPNRWAAIVPICGGGDPKQADRIKDIPCWCFHGETDTAVRVGRSRDMMKALWAAGGHPNYTEFPGVGHQSWDKAYATAELYPWLLEHHLK
jgi:predicted peptidase